MRWIGANFQRGYKTLAQCNKFEEMSTCEINLQFFRDCRFRRSSQSSCRAQLKQVFEADAVGSMPLNGYMKRQRPLWFFSFHRHENFTKEEMNAPHEQMAKQISSRLTCTVLKLNKCTKYAYFLAFKASLFSSYSHSTSLNQLTNYLRLETLKNSLGVQQQSSIQNENFQCALIASSIFWSRF